MWSEVIEYTDGLRRTVEGRALGQTFRAAVNKITRIYTVIVQQASGMRNIGRRDSLFCYPPVNRFASAH